MSYKIPTWNVSLGLPDIDYNIQKYPRNRSFIWPESVDYIEQSHSHIHNSDNSHGSSIIKAINPKTNLKTESMYLYQSN